MGNCIGFDNRTLPEEERTAQDLIDWDEANPSEFLSDDEMTEFVDKAFDLINIWGPDRHVLIAKHLEAMVRALAEPMQKEFERQKDEAEGDAQIARYEDRQW